MLNHEDISQLALGTYSLALLAIAIIFGWHAAWVHSHRLNALLDGKYIEATFNSRLAPTFFAVFVGLALVVHLLVQIVPVWLALGSGNMSDVYDAPIMTVADFNSTNATFSTGST